MSKTLFPAKNFMLVKQHEAEEKSGGLYIPPEHQKKPCEGTIVAVGPKCESEYSVVGSEIKFNKGAGVPVVDDIILICEDDILIYEIDEMPS